MNITDIIVHRGNSPIGAVEPLDQVMRYANAGFRKIEIDIYAVSEGTYKFCHPLDREKINELHNIDDGFLEAMVAQLPDIEWYVDLKCLDLNTVPLKLLQYLVEVFGDSGIITAAQLEILKFAHKQGCRTAQYFKENVPPRINYKPNFFIHTVTDAKLHPKEQTIVYCPGPNTAIEHLGEGFAGTMVDGNKLISN